MRCRKRRHEIFFAKILLPYPRLDRTRVRAFRNDPSGIDGGHRPSSHILFLPQVCHCVGRHVSAVVVQQNISRSMRPIRQNVFGQVSGIETSWRIDGARLTDALLICFFAGGCFGIKTALPEDNPHAFQSSLRKVRATTHPRFIGNHYSCVRHARAAGAVNTFGTDFTVRARPVERPRNSSCQRWRGCDADRGTAQARGDPANPSRVRGGDRT